MRSVLSFLAARALPCAMLFQLGCADDAQVGDDRSSQSTTGTGAGASGGGSPTSSGTSMSTSTGTSTGGAGAGGTGSGAGGSGVGGSGVGGAAGGGCPGAVLTVDGDGPQKQMNFACAGSWGASETSEANAHIGYEKPPSVDPNQKEQMWVDGCATANGQPMAGSISIEAPQVVVGTTMTGKAMYYDGIDAYAAALETDVTLTVLQIDDTVVKGIYTATVQTVNNSVKMLTGTFGVCRVADFLPP
jgi:hypothetical protein